MAILTDRRLFIRQVEKLHRKYLERGKLRNCSQDGLSFSRISMLRKSFAKTLAKQVAGGAYEFKPAKKRRIRKAKNLQKFRTIYLLEISDLVVHGVLAEILGGWAEPELSDGVFSYRAGRTWCDALSSFAEYIRAHVKARPRPEDRGLYLLRADVKEYTESIPVATYSSLWGKLRKFTEEHLPDPEDASAFYLLLQKALRPPVMQQNGLLASDLIGIPTGSPVGTVVANLYLSSLDSFLSKVPGAFYARYGDDFLFAHPDPAVTDAAEKDIFRMVEELGLRINASKEQRLYFNGAGRAPDLSERYTGTSVANFLGCSVSFKAEITIEPAAARGFLQSVRRRARKFKTVVAGAPLQERGRSLCRMINRLLDPTSPFSHPFSQFLARGVTNRAHLKELDYAIALTIAEALTGERGPKAFREAPYQRLREEWGLRSLVSSRNQA